jgi:23S rRNA-/tRNA-specific pseudouridylate synthase
MPGDPEPVEVLWEDEWLIAVNKPPRLVCFIL